jgi:hypothetical protein
MASAWLKAARGSTDGLVVPGRPTRCAAALLFAPTSVVLVFSGLEVSVRWDDIGAHWSLDVWRASESADSGVSLRASGPSAEAVVPVYDATRSKFNRLLYSLDVPERPGERVVPLFAARMARPRLGKERETLMVLGRFLAHEPALRERLTDVPTVDRLLAEIRAGSRSAVGERLHVRRGRVEVRTAMHALGLVHPYDGRPIPGRQPAQPKQDAVEAVLHYIASNRYAQGVQVDREEVADQVEREYFSVAPWPFHALVP